MKNKLFLLAALMVLVLPLSSFKSVNLKGDVKIIKQQTLYYLGDTERGGVGAYAVYGTSTGIGATITEVVSYSTGLAYNATGYTYSGKNNIYSGNLTAYDSNNNPFYTWNGILTF